MAEVKVIYDPKTGEIQVATEGFSGGACMLATKNLKESLGIVTDEHKTEEFYEKPLEQQQHKTQ